MDVTVYDGLVLPSGLSATPSPASTITSTPRTSSRIRSLDAFHRYLMRSLTPFSRQASSTLQTSRQLTVMPIFRNLSVRAEPTTPAAPITRIFTV